MHLSDLFHILGLSSSQRALFFQHVKHLFHVLVPSSGEVHDDDLVLLHRGCQFYRVGNSVSALQGRQNAFRFGQQLERLQHFFVGHGKIFSASCLLQVAVLRADAGIIQSRGDGVRWTRFSCSSNSTRLLNPWITAGTPSVRVAA